MCLYSSLTPRKNNIIHISHDFALPFSFPLPLPVSRRSLFTGAIVAQMSFTEEGVLQGDHTNSHIQRFDLLSPPRMWTIREICDIFDNLGSCTDGTPPDRVAQMMEGWGANGVGVNCDGPASVYNIATKMVAATHLPVIGTPFPLWDLNDVFLG